MTMNLTQCAIAHIEIVRVGEHAEQVMMMVKDQDDTVTNNTVVTHRCAATAFAGWTYQLPGHTEEPSEDQITTYQIAEPNEK
jgi:hypothetical protein